MNNLISKNYKKYLYLISKNYKKYIENSTINRTSVSSEYNI